MSSTLWLITHLRFPHHQAFTCLEICSNLCLVLSLRVLPCTPRSSSALLVSLWDAGVCKLNLLWGNYTSNILLIRYLQVWSRVLLFSSQLWQRLQSTEASDDGQMPAEQPISFLFVKYVIVCTHLHILLCKNIMFEMFGCPEYTRQVLSWCCLETWNPSTDIK